jgi:hypothetical protein
LWGVRVSSPRNRGQDGRDTRFTYKLDSHPFSRGLEKRKSCRRGIYFLFSMAVIRFGLIVLPSCSAVFMCSIARS